MRFSGAYVVLTTVLFTVSAQNKTLNDTIDAQWRAPAAFWNTDLNTVLAGPGTNGFVFKASNATAASQPSDVYNYCTMPHVNKQAYIVPAKEFKLEYVEVIHRHHRRTPYSANLVSSIDPRQGGSPN